MSDTTEIEKKSLEAHVELCAERYRFLEQKLVHMDDKIEGQGNVIREVHDMVQDMAEKRNDQVINWAIGVIALLVGIVGYLLATYLVK